MKLCDATAKEIAEELGRRKQPFVLSMLVPHGEDKCAAVSMCGTGFDIGNLLLAATNQFASLTGSLQAKQSAAPVKQGVSWLEEELAKP